MLGAVVVALAAEAASASGGYEGRPGSVSRTDRVYEYGKSIFHGRDRAHRGLEVCVLPAADEDRNAEAVRRRSMRRFRRQHARLLAESLVHCDAPGRLVGNDLDANEFQALLYYLNERYALRLES